MLFYFGGILSAFFCPSLSLNVPLLPSMSLSTPLCPSLSLPVPLYSSMSLSTPLCPSLLLNVPLYPFLFLLTPLCPSISIPLCPSLPLSDSLSTPPCPPLPLSLSLSPSLSSPLPLSLPLSVPFYPSLSLSIPLSVPLHPSLYFSSIFVPRCPCSVFPISLRICLCPFFASMFPLLTLHRCFSLPIPSYFEPLRLSIILFSVSSLLCLCLYPPSLILFVSTHLSNRCSLYLPLFLFCHSLSFSLSPLQSLVCHLSFFTQGQISIEPNLLGSSCLQLQTAIGSSHPIIDEILNNLWGLGTEYRNRVVVPAYQAT